MMTSRRFLTTIGATALGLGIVIGGGANAPLVFAQEETTPATESAAQADPAGDLEESRVEAYNAFVASLASELGVNDAEVDAAIRTALKEQLAQAEEEGNLDAELATELEQMIDEAEAPLPFGMIGMGGRGGMHVVKFKGGHFDGRGEHRGPLHGFGDRDDSDDAAREASEEESGPASLPSSDDADDQSAVADDATPEGSASS
jgi:hypothetical protein